MRLAPCRAAEIDLERATCDSKLRAVEETEVPLEHLHEEIHHHAERGGEKWISWVALSTAVLAVLAAIAGFALGQSRQRSNDETDRIVGSVGVLSGEGYQGCRA